MPRRITSWTLGALLSLLVIPSAMAQPSQFDPPPIVFRSIDASAYQEGCFAPCMCPILAPLPVEGSFDLDFTGVVDGFKTFTVQDVDWSVPILQKQAVGSGTYRFSSGTEPLQEMILDLQVNGGPVQRFQSGLVPVEAAFPEITIAISVHGFCCYDEVFFVRAEPGRSKPYVLATDDDIRLDPVAGAGGYDVVWGELDQLRTSGGDFSLATQGCLANDTPATQLPHDGDPPAGEGLWFLVRAPGNGDGESYESNGTGQTDARIAEIDSAAFHRP